MSRFVKTRLKLIRRTIAMIPPLSPLAWKRYHLRMLFRAVETDRNSYLQLTSIDEGKKRLYYPQVRRAINRFRVAQNDGGAGSILIAIACFGVMMPTVWAMAIYAVHLFRDAILNYYGMAFGAALTYFLIFLFPQNPETDTVTPLWFLSYPSIAITYLILNAWHGSTFSNPVFQMLDSCLAGAAALGAILTLISFAVVPIATYSAYRMRRHSDARILLNLIKIMRKVETGRVRWSDLQFRVAISRDIEKLARLIEVGLPYAYTLKGAAFRQWMSPRCKAIAEHVREMNKWLAMPKLDTRAYLLDELNDLLACFAQCNWDGLRTVESPLEVQRPGLAARIGGRIRVVVVSVLPAVLLLILHLLHRDPPDQLNTYLTFGAAVWLLVGMMGMIDPLYSARFESFKAALQLVPGSKKE